MSDDGDRRSRLRRWAPVAALALGLEALLAWLTFEGGSPQIALLGVVAAVTMVHVWARETPRLSPDGERNALFLLYVVGLVFFLGEISGWKVSYLVFIGITILTYALFALGLNLEFGYTGIINFGHVAFMGIGAYTTTILSNRWLPVADDLTEPSLAALVALAGSTLLVFAVVAVIVSAVAERILRQAREAAGEQGRVPAAAGGVAGAVAILAFVATVSFPLEPTWAAFHVVAAATLASMVLAALVGVILGFPTLRLREDYLAIVTIGAAEILRRVWRNEAWLTNGAPGLSGFALPRSDPRAWTFPLPLSESRAQWGWVRDLGSSLGLPDPYKIVLLLLVATALVVVFALYEILVHAPYGRVLKAIREEEEVADSLGKNVFAYKLQALALGSAVAALAGAFLAWQNVYINYRTFLPIVTFYAYIVVVLGGVGNNKGTIVGALFLWTFFESTRFLNLSEKMGITSSQAAAMRVALIGLLLIAFMMFKPEGLLGREEELAFEE
jgi:ABC-type branched-subunit amino acid transport system permease subunit